MEFWHVPRGQGLLLFGGATGDGARLMLDGWKSRSASHATFGCNTSVYNTIATRIVDQIRAVVQDCESWAVAGHSAGGALADMLQYCSANLGVNPPTEVMSLGSPATLGETLKRQGTNAGACRIMASGDGIPALPYGVTRSTLQSLLVLSSNDYAPWEYVHGHGGIVLRNNGDMIGDTGSGAAPGESSVETLVNLVISAQGFVGPHSIVEYIRRLSQASAKNEVVPGPAAALEARETVRVLTTELPVAVNPRAVPIMWLPQDMLTVSARSLVSGGTISFALEIPKMSNAQLRKPGTWYVTGANNVWQLQWHNEVVATFPSRSSAKTAAKYWNKALRCLGKSSDVNSASFTDSVAAFLATAGTQSGGFRPPLPIS